LMGKNHKIPVGDHKLFETQQLKKAVARSFEAHSKPQEDGLIKVYEQTVKQLGKLDTLAKIGTYLDNIQNVDERFTGRAIKTISQMRLRLRIWCAISGDKKKLRSGIWRVRGEGK